MLKAGRVTALWLADCHAALLKVGSVQDHNLVLSAPHLSLCLSMKPCPETQPDVLAF